MNTNSIISKVLVSVVILAILFTSIFVIGKWASSIDTYSKTVSELQDNQNQAYKLIASATVLSVTAAAIPGDSTTPLANKLTDIAGYMVIVLVAIILEKYLLSLTGFVAFKILIPAGLIIFLVAFLLLNAEIKITIYKLSAKFIIMGLLLWALVPASAWTSNKINDTYERISSEKDLSEDTISEDIDIVENNTTTETQTDDTNSLKGILNSIDSKVKDIASDTSETISNKVSDIKEELNNLIEKVAVLIVTTCVIPICVLLLFLWIIKTITGFNIFIPTPKKILDKSKNFITSKDE